MKQTQTINFNYTLVLYFTIALVTLGTLFFYSLATLSPIFSLDDPYIVLHNAQVLHNGYDQNYIHTPALYGTTSAVHLLLVYLLTFCFSAPTSLFIISGFAFIAYVCGLLRLAFLFKASLLQTIIFMITALTIFYTPCHFINGLETGLVLAATIWLLCMAYMPANSCARRTILPCLGGLFAYIRPELGVLVVLIILLQGWGEWRYLLHQGICLFLSALPWMSWYGITTGHLLPQTMSAKMIFYGYTNFSFAQRLKGAIYNTSKFSLIFGYYFGFCGLIALLLINKLGRILLIFMLTFWGIYALYFYGGLSPEFNLGRYWAPCIPLLFFGLLNCLQHENITLRIIANTLLYTLCFSTLLVMYSYEPLYVNERQASFNAYKNTTEWCKAHIPSNEVIMIHDAGYIAYASPFRLIDLVGLKTPENTLFYQIKNKGRQISSLEGIKGIINSSHPNYFILAKYWDKYYSKNTMSKDLLDERFKLTLIRKAKYYNDYSVYKISYF